MTTLISENLKRYRRIKDLSQRELARRSGVSQSEISRIEASENFPELKTIQKLAKALGQKPENLVKGAMERLEQLHTLEHIRKCKQTTLEEAIEKETKTVQLTPEYVGREIMKALIFGVISGGVFTFGVLMLITALLS